MGEDIEAKNGHAEGPAQKKQKVDGNEDTQDGGEWMALVSLMTQEAASSSAGPTDGASGGGPTGAASGDSQPSAGKAPSSSDLGDDKSAGVSESAGSKTERDYNLTGWFVQLPPEIEESTDEKNDAKTKFLEADVLVPGIALKKFKQALHDEMGEGNEINMESFLGVTSIGDFKRYKKSRHVLQRMAMGDVEAMKDKFWNSVAAHMKDHSIAAIFKTSSSRISVQDATRHIYIYIYIDR